MSEPTFRPVAIIPVYDHDACLESIVRRLLAENLPVILVDDASHAHCAQVMERLTEKYADQGVFLQRHAMNGGKGAAVITGLKAAHRLGYSHALQVDADGQHGLDAVPDFLSASQDKPEALICGYPVYDETVPGQRKSGREISNFWVRVNGLSKAVRDSLCGFRVYPIETMMQLFSKYRPGSRMDFDCQVLVFLLWEDVPIVNKPVSVTYPMDGVSHFRLFRDNVEISWMHTRMFFGMLLRLPKLLKRQNV